MRIEPTQDRPGLQLRGNDGRATPIHPLWLRERADDAAHMDQDNWQRLYDPSDLDPALCVTAAAETAPGIWQVRFSDGVAAEYAADRLLAEAASEAARPGLPERTAWTAELSPLPVIAWQPATPAALLHIVTTFLRLGFAILRGVPTAEGSVLEVARAFGHPRETNFGVLFDVRSVPNPSDLAYTGLALAPHTDNPYRDPVPGVQLLHCLANRSTGGLSTLVDGLAVATALRDRDPAAYRILSSVPVRWEYRHDQTHMIDYAPVIQHDAGGQIAGLRFSPKLDFVPLLPEAELSAFYAARRTLGAMLRAPEFLISFLLEDGDLVMFDNRRLLHGRTGFDPQEGVRHLQGCYIDIDTPRSLYRVLQRGAEQAALAEARRHQELARTQVSFRHMIDGTREDYLLLQQLERPHMAGTAERVLRELRRQNEESFEGYQISRLDHALQTATRAERDGADIDWIVAALLHDIGDGLAPQNHDRFAAEMLRPFVREEVTWAVEHHGAFQMVYYAHYYGWNQFEREKYRDSPYFQGCAEFCGRWDQAAFDPDYPTETLEHFAPLVHAVFARKAYDPSVVQAGVVMGVPVAAQAAA